LLTDHRSPITEEFVCESRAPDRGLVAEQASPPPPGADDWPSILQASPKAARIARLLLESGLLTFASVRRLTLDELRGSIGPAHARVVADALEAARMPMIDKPTPRAGAPPGQPRAGPSNRIAAAEADRQARTRRMLDAPALDPFAPPQITGEPP
jgi:hypothetical protein